MSLLKREPLFCGMSVKRPLLACAPSPGRDVMRERIILTSLCVSQDLSSKPIRVRDLPCNPIGLILIRVFSEIGDVVSSIFPLVIKSLNALRTMLVRRPWIPTLPTNPVTVAAFTWLSNGSNNAGTRLASFAGLSRSTTSRTLSGCFTSHYNMVHEGDRNSQS
jgi:hypothetical protein